MLDDLPPGAIWLVGCGNLGRAMLDGWLDAGLPAERLTVINPSPRELPAGVRYASAPDRAGPPPDIAVLAVKPQRLAEVAPALARAIGPALVVSVLAGAPLAALAAAFRNSRVVRALPNTPARVRRATTLLAASDPTATDRRAVTALMTALGGAHWIDEPSMDAAGAITGCGPAFLFAFIEALAAAGTAAGLDVDLAARLALDTVAGAAALAAVSDEAPAQLRARVTSPNGTTQAGLAVLDGEGVLTTLLADTVRASARRSAELGEEARA